MPQQDTFSSHVEAFEKIPLHKNKETGPLAKGHNSYSWEFQQSDGRSVHQQWILSELTNQI